MKGSILIVEDEAVIAEMLRDYFVGQDYEVEVAMNGGDALMLASQKRPDAVLLDSQLPGISGAEVLSQLRALDESLAIVMLSGADDEGLARALLKAGAFDCVRKPFNFDRLDHVVGLAVAVGRQKPRHGVVLPFRSDRRAAVAAPPDETVISRSCCGTCGQAITDEPKAVVDKGAVFHATCWLQRGVKGRQ
jgi:DNA-binding response OmpR family regulator